MNTHIWETELSNELKEEITNYLKNMNENKTYLLDISKNEFSLIEKYIYDISCFHFKMLGLDINKNYIVFELKNSIYFSDSNNIKINENKYSELLLSCESYFNKFIYPTIITDIDLENYKYKEFNKKNKLQFIFPEDNKHITFDGSRFHGVLKINELGEQKNNNYLSITINLFGDKPNNITYFSNNDNNDNNRDNHTTIYFKEPSIIHIKDNNKNLKTINKKECLFDYDFYENIFYNNKGKIELPSIVIQEIKNNLNVESGNINNNNNNNNNVSVYNYYFVDNYDENTVDLVKNKKFELINKQVETMRKIDCNKDNVNNYLLGNRFIQRFTYKNIFSKNVCEWIINESELYANANAGWNINKYEGKKITQYLQADKLKSIFGFILFSFNDIFNKVKKSYCLTENITFNINDIFIIKNQKDITHSIKEKTQNSFFTMYVLLSDELTFKDSGISFHDGISEFLNQGDLIIHSSKVKNSELEIYEGNKYVLLAHIDLSIV
jgi:hypothetical protein